MGLDNSLNAVQTISNAQGVPLLLVSPFGYMINPAACMVCSRESKTQGCYACTGSLHSATITYNSGAGRAFPHAMILCSKPQQHAGAKVCSVLPTSTGKMVDTRFLVHQPRYKIGSVAYRFHYSGRNVSALSLFTSCFACYLAHKVSYLGCAEAGQYLEYNARQSIQRTFQPFYPFIHHFMFSQLWPIVPGNKWSEVSYSKPNCI